MVSVLGGSTIDQLDIDAVLPEELFSSSIVK